MNTKQFSEALSNVNDKYINEALAPDEQLQPQEEISTNDVLTAQAAPAKAAQTPKKLHTHLKVWRAIAIAACAILVIGGGLAAWTALDGASYKRADSYRDYETSGMPSYSGTTPSYNGAYDSKDGMAYEAEAAGEYEYAMDEEVSFIPIEQPAGGKDSGMTGNVITDDGAVLNPAENGLKIIYTAYINMETTQFDESVRQIEELAKKNNAYFEMAGVSSASTYYRSASYVVRVPADQLDSFLEGAQGICTVTSLQKYAEDVSESYFDVETRLETAKIKLARLRELLAAASDMQDIITLENEISSTQYQIDSLTGTLNHYDSQISYSTVSIDLREVYRVNEENAPLTFGQHITKAFKEGLAGFGNFLEGLLIFLAGNWIWLLILAAVIVVVILLIVRGRRKHRKQK